MKNLELFLDESGDFCSDDANWRKHPSIIGGVLSEKGKISHDEASRIIGNRSFHGVNEDAEAKIGILHALVQIESKFVIFENQERIHVIDDITTYLNVMAEGIVQLLLALSAEYEKFSLDIFVSTKRNGPAGSGIIPPEEYIKKITERIKLGLVRRSLIRKESWRFFISFADARYDQRLMLADCCCNTFLTRASSKFTNEQKLAVESVFSEKYRFTLYEDSSLVQIKRYLAEGKLGDAIFDLCMISDLQPDRKKYLELALEKMSMLNDYGMKNNFMLISNRIESCLKLDRDFVTLKRVLEILQNELIPLASEKQCFVPEFALDVNLYLYTVYTHEGNINGEFQDTRFNSLLVHVGDILKRLDYSIMYKNRRCIHKKNMLDVEGALRDVTWAIDRLEDTLSALSLVNEIQTDIADGAGFEQLAKAYGTRLQCWTMLIGANLEKIHEARSDYEKAMFHFRNSSDKKRQILYLSQAETEAGNFAEALAHLLMWTGEKIQLGADNTGESCVTFIEQLMNRKPKEIEFAFYTYVRILAYAKRNNDPIAEMLYLGIKKNNLFAEKHFQDCKGSHPMEFAYWFLGEYAELSGDFKYAKKLYDLAIKQCGENLEDITMDVIKIGVLISKTLMLKNHGESQAMADSLAKLKKVWQQTINRISTVDQYIDVDLDLLINSEDRSAVNQYLAKIRCIN